MRLARLALTAFGPFTGATIDLAAPGPAGVVDVVFGPNEAGKSTTLRAIGDLLFGFPHQTPDAHLHRTQDLLLGATLVGPNDERWDVVRTKGKKDTLRTPEGEVADEAKLSRWLGGISRDLFERAWGLDHETLRTGAEELLQGEGDAAELLFSAALGRTGVVALERELREEADAIFTPRGKTQPLHLAVKAFRDAKTNSEGTDRSAWERQRAEIEQLREEQAQLARAREALVTERTLVDKLLRVLGVATTNARHVKSVEGAIADLEQRARAIVHDEAIAALAGRIDVLAERLPNLRRAELDRPTWERERSALAAELSRIAGDEGPALRDEGALGRALAALEPLEELALQRTALAARVRDARAEAVHPADPEAEGVLRRALERVRALGDVAATRSKLERARDRASAERAARARALPWSSDDFDPLPSAQVDRYERTLAEREAAVATAKLELARSERELEAKRAEREKSLGPGAPPTPDDLHAARAARDLLLAEGGDGRALEALVRRADEIADAMLASAERVGKLQALDVDVRLLERATEAARATFGAANAALAAARDDWRRAAGVDVAPAAFRELAALHGEVRRLAAEVAEHAANLREHDERSAEAFAALERALGTTGDADRVARAEARLELLADARAASLRLAKDEATLTTVSAEYDAVVARAEEALAAAGLPRGATPREAKELVARHRDAERARRALADLDEKIARAASERARLEDEIAELARLANEPIAGTLLDCGEALVRRHRAEVERAKERATVAKDLAAKKASLAGEARTLEEQRAEIAETVAALGAKFVDRGNDESNLGALEIRREALEQELDAIDDRLRRVGHDLGGRTAGLHDLESRSTALDASAEMEAERARVRDLALRFARLRAASVLLRREMERYRASNEAPVVARAGAFFERLTLGSFRALRVDDDEKGAPVLRAVRASGGSLDVKALSEGSRDQLYLALRLATLMRTAETTDPLPLVLDDVLVHFDDDRARATFEVLGEIAGKMQVVLFTHHEHVTALARAALGERAAVHRLAERLAGAAASATLGA
jgi:uncharacterized protein YhaN